MQTILGSGGAIGIELAKALTQWTTEIRLVSRNPKKVNESDSLFPANLTNREEIFKAVEGSSVCYVTVGFEYNTKVWQETWPSFMQNVVDACIQHEAKLVFFDNIYAIGGDNVKHITELSPVSPTSKKGVVRAKVDQIILDGIKTGKLQAIIARSPDFFGPKKDASMLMIMTYDNLIKGKKSQWFCSADKVHSMGYTPDLALGTALLGNSSDGWNQIWNLPVDSELLTGRQWADLFVSEMGGPRGIQVLPGWMVGVIGWFVPIMKELSEMTYQFDREYFFDSSKFNQAFNFKPASNREAVRKTIEVLKKG